MQQNELLANIERRKLWSHFHKDWLLAIRGLIRPQIPRDYAVFVESEVVLDVEETCELYSSYSLLIRRAPEQRLIAALEILSPTNKGVFGPLDKEKYLRKRDLYLEAGVNLLELDALLEGDRILPSSLQKLENYTRTVWRVAHHNTVRRFRGWGWNDDDPLPKVAWLVEPGRRIIVDLPQALAQACEFNPWETLATA